MAKSGGGDAPSSNAAGEQDPVCKAAIKVRGGGFEPGFNLGSSSNLGSTWVRTFGRVRVVPGFRELNIEPGFNLGSHWVPFNLD